MIIVGRPAVVLIGFMGAGKSTVGRVLAGLIGVDFIDTDTEIERREGRTIPEIFTAEGAARFREIERDVVTDVLATHRGVVALGGGAVTTPAVAEALDGHRVVHLRIGPEAGFARVAGTDRPMLATDDPAARYRELLAERAETYRDVATIEVDAGAGDAETVADLILAEIAQNNTVSGDGTRRPADSRVNERTA
nr:shikimate kinase [Gordonia sp. NB41Y]